MNSVAREPVPSAAVCGIHSKSNERQLFEDAMWMVHYPGEIQFNRLADGSYIDKRVEKGWHLWIIARGGRE